MMTRQFITLIILMLCGLTARGQQVLSFENPTRDFGTIREADGPVSHTFTGVNRSDKPLVILDVVTSCGCTVPRFSKQPILPGGKTEITVTYDPANRPGIFNKDLTVYSSERKKIATLTVQGSVTPRPKSLEELYPIDAGGGLRLTTTLNAPDRCRGRTPPDHDAQRLRLPLSGTPRTGGHRLRERLPAHDPARTAPDSGQRTAPHGGPDDDRSG